MKLENITPKKEKVELDLYPLHKKISIYAIKIGKYLAVHKTLHNKKFFTVTHVPTGMSIETEFKTRQEAINWAKNFNKKFKGKELEFSKPSGEKFLYFKKIHKGE